MLAEFDARSPRFLPRGALLSVAVHAACLLVIAVWAYRAPPVAHFKLPGTERGINVLTYYSPGSRQPSKMTPTLRHNPIRDAKLHTRTDAAKPAPTSAEPPKADAGSGNAAESGVGEGDISIALLQHFPPPQPDISTLPHGTNGDVVLDAVIDEHGKVSELTLVKGLDPFD